MGGWSKISLVGLFSGDWVLSMWLPIPEISRFAFWLLHTGVVVRFSLKVLGSCHVGNFSRRKRHRMIFLLFACWNGDCLGILRVRLAASQFRSLVRKANCALGGFDLVEGGGGNVFLLGQPLPVVGR